MAPDYSKFSKRECPRCGRWVDGFESLEGEWTPDPKQGYLHRPDCLYWWSPPPPPRHTWDSIGGSHPPLSP